MTAHTTLQGLLADLFNADLSEAALASLNAEQRALLITAFRIRLEVLSRREDPEGDVVLDAFRDDMPAETLH